MTRSLLIPLALLLVAGIVAIGLSAGFWGRLHPAFDSFSHFRLHLAAMLAATGSLLLITRFRREGVFALLFAGAAVAVTPGTAINQLIAADAQAETGDGGAPVYRLLQFNGRFDNRRPEAFLSLVGRTRPDVITMQEVSPMWRERLAPLKTAYPHQILCDARGAVGGVAILSRRPILEGTQPGCLDGGAFALATLDFGGTALQVAAIHLYWPWPFEQPRQIERLRGVLEGLSDSAILAGDFNAARWSHSVRSIAASASMRDVGPVGPSWLSDRLPAALRPWAGLSIDHVFGGARIVPRQIERREDAGSDHLPVMFEFSLEPSEAAPDRQTDVVTNPILVRPTS